MPTEGHAQKMSRTSSEDNLNKFFKRSVSHNIFGEAGLSNTHIPNSYPFSAIIEVEWIKRTQKIELNGNYTFFQLFQTIAHAFNLDLDFIAKIALTAVLEHYHISKYEPLNETNFQNIYHGSRLRLVIIDSDYGE